MNERVKFIAEWLRHEESVTALCRDAGICRKTGYKWIDRYEQVGVAALAARSRVPRSHPHAVPAEEVEAILAIRRQHPRWGPRKLLVVLGRPRFPDGVVQLHYEVQRTNV